MQRIRVRNLTKIFGDQPEEGLKLLKEGVAPDKIHEQTGLTVGLNDVSFDVDEGEILVVMGLSGSGKSTLIRCVNRLIEPTAGSVEVDGEDILQYSADKLFDLRRRKFGMVFQNFALLPNRTIVDNVAFGLEIQGVERAEREESARRSLELVGLKGWEEAYPSQLSGGMQQRVGLARALAVDPDILLMDEAFSALDPLIRRDMQNELIDLQSRMHKTILFITHDLDEALKLGDRIVLMKSGGVVQIGTPEEILSNPATRYVQRFVEDVDKSQVLTAGSIMGKARVVAFESDGPRTALHKMEEESYYSLFVTSRDFRVKGVVWADDCGAAIKRGDKDLSRILDTDFHKVREDTPLAELITLLAESRIPLAVVDERDKLLGTVVKSNVLSALAETQESDVLPDHPGHDDKEDAPPATAAADDGETVATDGDRQGGQAS
ncbi:quaternary amine ABC transporter ATP-binding protein [Alkalilimnicola ehrlichii MLHE-1]|uniref:Quaternary amine transport ATP-binding protein n=1 Tax=Alkalilimnicola ehrlichii (strain ATCC BAA-1101 / DSM 17681 / MLHE-1) TaxID=187272 RepID=Q0AAQ1_ALKEH|nr:glycine betaine/L-proline ABC transporter ATP-binding protein [Alkalilimnicola ehrlichii]ABI56086.1 glycine betaine/L-proline ABC transporter, ATPase subunit [Alkalilimnicola ehrlichii MLHE-1]